MGKIRNPKRIDNTSQSGVKQFIAILTKTCLHGSPFMVRPLSASTQTRSLWCYIWNYKFSQSVLEKMPEWARVNRYLLAETEQCKRVQARCKR